MRLIWLVIFLLRLLLLKHWNMWLSSSSVCQHDAHLLLWKWSLLCTLSPVGSFLIQNLCIHCTPFSDICYVSYIPVGKCPSLYFRRYCHSIRICCSRTFLVVLFVLSRVLDHLPLGKLKYLFEKNKIAGPHFLRGKNIFA
jgi:hypothetical protein